MPVKIRCKGCEKVLNVPDAARGKVVKCPSCGARLRIPGGAPAAKAKKAAAKPARDEGNFLANLDLSKVEDTSVRVCPKCGATVNEDDIDCPKCGVDLETGVISARTRRKLARKGAEPKEYYRDAIKDAVRFIGDNKSLAFRTFFITLLFTSACFGCNFMVMWSSHMPPKVFWAFCAFLTSMVTPGWAWHLWLEVVRGTLNRKKKLKRVNFDIFLSAALGIKFFIWRTVFTLGAGIIGGFLVSSGHPVVGGAVMELGFLLTLPLVPIAMAHMAMPVTYRGWLSPSLLGVFWKTAGPALFWALLFVLTMHLPLAALAAIPYVLQLATWAAILALLSGKLALAATFSTTSLIVVAVLWVVGCLLYAFCILFNMRTSGLFAQYFHPNLDLIALVAEKKYVPKIKRPDEFYKGPQPESIGKKVGIGLLASFLLGLIGGAVFGMVSGNGFIIGVGTGLLIAGYLTAFVGGIMILVAAFQESPMWGIGCLLVPFVSLIFVIVHWNEAKWGFLINLVGGFMVGLGLAATGFRIFSEIAKEVEKEQAGLECRQRSAVVCRVDTVPGRFTITL